ncbi:MAG: hypothetical protein HY907_18100 [Deltaproteobacteria bacterium]|nr:hypothetical protein [Deltaproteobacteria bacterium]
MVTAARLFIYIFFAAATLTELLSIVGWEGAAVVVGAVFGFLAVFVGPPALLYLIVKWFRGEAEFP